MNTEMTKFNVNELSRTELVFTNGGGKAWETFGKIIGYTIGFLSDVHDAWSSTPEGAACQQALLDFQ